MFGSSYTDFYAFAPPLNPTIITNFRKWNGETYESINNIKPKQVDAYDYYVAIIDQDGDLYILGAPSFLNLVYSVPTQIPGIKIKQISAGLILTAIDDDDNVLVWGTNFGGRLGLNSSDYELIAQGAKLGIKAKFVSTKLNTMIIDRDDNVLVFGLNSRGTLGLGDHTERIIAPTPIGLQAKKVITGSDINALIDLEDNLWLCGKNESGQLGLGDLVDRTIFTQVPGIKAKDVVLPNENSLVIDLDGNVLVCGSITRSNGFTRIPNFKAASAAAGVNHILLLGLDTSDL